ncbi:MAG: AmiS/UreI family transporter [Coriobacteriia bacterium]|nr:AmiS/UreI family transporter [Coriobacteriia bacterium]
MLGVNLVFAGFALALNGLSYLMSVDDRVKGVINLLVGLIIAVNAVFQTALASDHISFGFAAAMWMFALNYFIIAAHIFFKSENWKAFGLFSLFASTVSFVFAGDVLFGGGPAVMVYLWLMWAVLWLQSFGALLLGSKPINKLSPYVLITNGIASTFVPGLLILLGVIL